MQENANLTIASSTARISRGNGHGFALVIVLAFIALLTFLLVAFLSRSVNEQQLLTSSNAQARVNQLAKGAIASIIGDLKQEIAAGSILDTDTSSKVTIYNLTSNQTVMPAFAYATGTTAPPINVLKRSASGVTFFPNSVTNNNYSANFQPSSLASPASTTGTSLNGRSITQQRWNAPYLLDPSAVLPGGANTFLPPDWTIVTRAGPRAFPVWDDALKNDASTNTAFAVGRYAYVIYDEGGLLDVNVAGNSLDASRNSRRGRLNQADLSQIPGLSGLDIQGFLKWRGALTGTNDSSVNHQGGLFDPSRDFTRVQSGAAGSDQTFINRQDLITYARQHPDQFGPDLKSLQYLGTFSREDNAPSFSPMLLSGSASVSGSINPALSHVRFAITGTLADGSIVTPGMPLVRKRFPLGRLAWVTAKGPSADNGGDVEGTASNIMLYFGLMATGTSTYKTWSYRPSGASGSNPASSILALQDLALQIKNRTITARDPDFFELLKATILNGSMGQNYSVDTVTNSAGRDQNTDVHVMQIGANLIDQYDSDDLPTVISFTNSSFPNQNLDEAHKYNIRGVENLPYLDELSFLPYRPQGIVGSPRPVDLLNLITVAGRKIQDTKRPYVCGWLIPRLWNPHQALRPADSTITLRLVASGGQWTYSVSGGDANNITRTGSSSLSFSGSTDMITFTNDNRYSDPVVITGSCVNALLSQSNSIYSGTSPQFQFIHPPPGSTILVPQGTPLDFAGFYIGSTNAPHTWLGSSGTSQGAVAANFNSGKVSINSVGAPTVFELQYSADGTTFYPYQRIQVGFFENLTRQDYLVPTEAFAISGTPDPNVKGVNLMPSIQNLRLMDPRSPRLGAGEYANASWDLSSWWGPQTFPPTSSGTAIVPSTVENPQDLWYNRPWGSLYIPSVQGATQTSNPNHFRVGYYSVNSDTLDPSPGKQTYYRDPDGVLRRADGDDVHDVHPTFSVSGTTANTATGRDAIRSEDRPLILNRPFRSVGEMGYAFRDVPWKTLDFFSANSGDAGLLDAFSIDDNQVVGGRVNLNTRQSPVLQAMLAGTLRAEITGTSATPAVIDVVAGSIASFITTATSSTAPGKGRLANRSDLATKILADPDFPVASTSDYIKTRREATVRALAEAGQTRTWNLMIDVIAQSGRYPVSVNSAVANPLSKFVVEGERRYWVHLAIDRFTGEIIDEQVEPVYE